MPAIVGAHARRSYEELRRANQKAAAILVAIVLCAALRENTPSVATNLATALSVYIATHVGAVVLVSYVHGKVFDQLTMMCAELVAFLWLDTCQSFFDFVASDGHQHLWTLAWAAAMLLFGIAWLRAAHSLRSRCKARDAMLDVEADVCGLAVGRPLFLTLAACLWGEEWREQLESPHGGISDVCFFGAAFLVSIGVAALALRDLERRGFDEEGPQMKALSSGAGFFIAYLMDQFILTVLMGPLRPLFDIELDEEGGSLSVGKIVYPFVVLAVGSLVISFRANRAKPWSAWCDKVFIWSYQIAMALAFEGLLDEVVDQQEEGDTRGARLAIAAVIVGTWAIVCIIWAYACHGFGQGESKIAPIDVVEPEASPDEVGMCSATDRRHDITKSNLDEETGQLSGESDKAAAGQAWHAVEGCEVGEDIDERAHDSSVAASEAQLEVEGREIGVCSNHDSVELGKP